MKQLLFLLLLFFFTQAAMAGGGKEAYRNYFLGSYYFSEGNYGRAENHLRKAYQLHPIKYNFALAYALSFKFHPQASSTGQLLKHVAFIIHGWPRLLEEWVANAFEICGGQCS